MENINKNNKTYPKARWHTLDVCSFFVFVLLICFTLCGCCSADNELADFNDQNYSYDENCTDEEHGTDKSCSQNKSQDEKKSDTNSSKNSVQVPSEETMAAGKVTKSKVVRVVDGDTIKAQGFNDSIRFPSVNAPEKDSVAGQAAKSYVESILYVGRDIWLEEDTKSNDVYGRYILNVWLDDPGVSVTPSKVKDKMMDGLLVSNGYATAVSYSPVPKYYNWLVKIK